MFWVWVVGGFVGVGVAFYDWMASSENGEGFGLECGQGSPCLRMWLLLGLMHFVGFGGVSGYGWIWVKFGLDWLKLGVKGVLAEKFQGSSYFRLWLPLGLVHFGGFGDVSGSRWIWVEAEACLVCDDGKVGFCWEFFWGSTYFRLCLPLGVVHFMGFGGVSGSRGI